MLRRSKKGATLLSVVPQEDHVMTIMKVISARNDEVLAFWQCQAQWQRAANDALANFYC
jgi:hypothetical protein